MNLRKLLSYLLPLAGAHLFLLSAPAQTVDDYIAFVEACQSGDLKGVESGLAKGIHIDQPDGNMMTPLIHALYAEQHEVAKALISRGANVNAVATTSLHRGAQLHALVYAIKSGDAGIVKLMLERGANPEPVRDENSPVLVALQWDNAPALELLAARGVDLKKWRFDDAGALYHAVKNDSLACAKYLLDSGASPEEKSGEGVYPLNIAAYQSSVEMVDLLLNKGANPNSVSDRLGGAGDYDPAPYTALDVAVRKNRFAVVKRLLEAGADPKLLENQAIKFADLAGNRPIYDLLRKHGAPEPGLYSFTKIKGMQPEWIEFPRDGKPPTPIDWGFHSMINRRQQEKAPEELEVPLSVAVISENEEANEAGDLLTADLSDHESLRVLERDQIAKLLREQSLTYDSFADAAKSVVSGKLLGADALVLLSENDEGSEARIVASGTGLVLDLLYSNEEEDPEDWASRITDSLIAQASALRKSPKDWTLISIPQITSAMGATEGLEIEKQLSKALAKYLAAQENIYILERRGMNRLVLEKTLTEEARQFYSSGWLLDGTFDLPKDQPGQINITLRLRSGEGGKEIRIEEQGTLHPPHELLQKLTAKVLEQIGAGASQPGSLEADGKAYLAEAKRAVDANLWELAQHAADAAWALGRRDDVLREILVCSMEQRIRSSREIIRSQKIEKLSAPAQSLAYRAPLLLPQVDSRELSADQYLELANSILDVFDPLTVAEAVKTKGDLKLLSLFSRAIMAANAPLEVMHSMSAEQVHHAELEQLRGRLRKMSKAILRVAEKKQLPFLYYQVWGATMDHLSYWERDDIKLAAEIRALIKAEAVGPGLPYSKKTKSRVPFTKQIAFHILYGIATEKPFAIGGHAKSVWARIAPELAKSEILDEKMLGLHLLLKSAKGMGTKFRLSDQITETTLELLRIDESCLGTSPYGIYYSQQTLPNDLDYEPMRWLTGTTGMWLQDPLNSLLGEPATTARYNNDGWLVPAKLDRKNPGRLPDSTARTYIPRQRLRAEMREARLETMLNTEATVFPEFLSEGGIRTEEVAKLLPLVANVETKVAERFKSDDPTLGANLIVWQVTNLRKQIEEKSSKPATPSAPPQLDLGEFLMPWLEYGHLVPNDMKSNLSHFEMELFRTRDEGTWIGVQRFGFVLMDRETRKLKECILIPPDSQFVGEYGGTRGSLRDTLFVDDRYLAIAFEKLKGKDSSDIGLYDRISKQWRFFSPEGVKLNNSDLGVRSISVLEKSLYFSFLAHPNPDRYENGEDLKDSLLTRGVGEINLETGRQTLFVSSRRSPPLNPLDSKKWEDDNEPLWPLSRTTFQFLDTVYDESTGTWRKPKPEEHVDLPWKWGYSSVKWQTPQVELASNPDFSMMNLKVTPREKNASDERTSVFIVKRPDLTKLKIPPEWSRIDSKKLTKLESYWREHMVRDGIFLTNNYGFYYIPKENILKMLEADVQPAKVSPAN